MVKISINFPQYAPGTEIAIAGLGRFENGGEEVELDEAAVAEFEQEQGMSVAEALKNNPGVTVDGQEGQPFEPPAEEAPAEEDAGQGTETPETSTDVPPVTEGTES